MYFVVFSVKRDRVRSAERRRRDKEMQEER
jgi:hypothetical protein